MNSAPEIVEKPIWEFVPVSEYKLPVEPVAHTARKGLAIFRRLFRSKAAAQTSPYKTEDELKMLPRWQVDRISTPFDWGSAAEALNIKIEDWLGQEASGRPIIVLVGPPYAGTNEVLNAWAERQTRPLLKPPTAEQILTGDGTWFPERHRDAAPWVFPALERTFLRHTAGLSLVRDFLSKAFAGDLGRGIIGCDSWAWTFLSHAWHCPTPIALTLQAFDNDRLATHLQGVAGTYSDKQLLFRQANNGHYVFPPPVINEDSIEMSNFMHLLAAYSRGIPEVAWAIWCSSLRTGPDEVMTGKAASGDYKALRQSVWVTPWDQLNHPSLSEGAGEEAAVVLHTLLLHNGLTSELLQQVLPFPQSQTTGTLLQLEAAGLIVSRGNLWKVSPGGYPPTRRFLEKRGYFMDQF